jgi:superfamily I DNA and/or RNA helicase
MGLVFHHLTDTVYDRGGTRTNVREAEIVAEAVMEHGRTHPKLSLGVVAFSTAQREAIQDALELKRKAAPELEDFFKVTREEPFFVKNLENVQGDERDVMFISIGYGP